MVDPAVAEDSEDSDDPGGCDESVGSVSWLAHDASESMSIRSTTKADNFLIFNLRQSLSEALLPVSHKPIAPQEYHNIRCA